MANNLQFNGNNGAIDICKDSRRNASKEPLFMCWDVNSGSMFGTAANSPALRLFLKRALVRLEIDATRRGEIVS